jgi:hypothetical protein
MFGDAALALRAAGRSRDSVTPVEKVIALLHRLEAQVTQEGQNEATEYDKFACFCKEQADFTLHAIEKSNKTTNMMTATIEELADDLVELGIEIRDLGARIATIDTAVSEEKGNRSLEHGKYKNDAANLTDAIAAMEDAIASLQASKGALVNAKVDFAQLSKATGGFISGSKLERIVAATTSKQQPAAYEYNSNEIIDLLQDLLATFKRKKKELDEVEFEAMDISSKKVLALVNERKFKKRAKSEKEELEGQKSEQKAETEAAKAAEETARADDEEYQADLVQQCANRATEWDQRSQARSAELTAMAKAIEILKASVSTTYSANKKLVGFTQRHSLSKDDPSSRAAETIGKNSTNATVSAISLLQFSGTGKASASVQRALARINDVANRLGSSVLASIAAKIGLQEDHFVKVRGLIKDLIARLEEQALAEKDQKNWCDEEMERVVETRDGEQSVIEQQSATISEKKALEASLLQEIATLAKEIASLQRALNEATELRTEEKAVNEKTVVDAEAGKVAVEQALEVLRGFYGSGNDASFIGVVGKSKYEPYKPANSDREGKTVADRAPTMSYSGDYTGKQAESNGVIGLLEVILSDFERTGNTVKEQELASQSDFDGFESDTQRAVEAKNTEKGTKEAEKTSTEDAIMSATDDLKTATNLHESAIKELETLQKSCVDGEESWEERKAQREKEIEALKEAMHILDTWQE